MAPQQSNPAEVDTIDVIDVASSEEKTHDPLPQQNPPKAELKQERRMENVRRVRDEADSLRQEICQLRIRLEEVEEESKFHAAKANELTELLMNCNNGNGVDETALKQSESLAKKDCQIESLEKKITKLETEKALLVVERDNVKKEMAMMSNVVRSLQNVAKGSPDNSYHEDDDSEDEESEDEAVVLTPETALDLTLGNLKDHIEMLEDGLQASSSLNSTQKKAISTLQADIKAQQAQIGMLEALFKDLNAADRIAMMKEQEDAEAKKNEEGSDNSATKGSRFGSVFAIKNSSKVTTEEPTEKSQEDSTPKEDTKKSYFGSVFSSKKSQKTSDEDASNDDSNEKLHDAPAPQEDAKASKGSYFDVFSGISAPKLLPSREPRKPEIPTSALAAQQAAEILLGKTAGEENVPKMEKKTKMKKVKIKFKKAGLEGTYTGPLVDKKPHGIGTIRFTNGNTYLGEMTRGKMSGSGTLYTKNGVFRGLFENNRFVGESGDETSDKPSDAKATATEMNNNEDDKVTNAMAALELDAFSPSNIDDVIDDSFNMTGNLDGMERKAELAEIQKFKEREENESFLKEFSGSEHSSSMGNLDESNSSSSDADQEDVL